MKYVVALLFVLQASIVSAQTDPCMTGVQPFVVTSGAPYTVTWLMDALVPASSTDPTLVPPRIDGFYFQVDATTKTKISVTSSPVCGTGTPNAGKMPYTYRTVNGVTRGSHTVRLSAFNFVLDQSGNPTAQEQESAVVSVPFSAVDLLEYGPPPSPVNVIIRR